MGFLSNIHAAHSSWFLKEEIPYECFLVVHEGSWRIRKLGCPLTCTWKVPAQLQTLWLQQAYHMSIGQSASNYLMQNHNNKNIQSATWQQKKKYNYLVWLLTWGCMVKTYRKTHWLLMTLQLKRHYWNELCLFLGCSPGLHPWLLVVLHSHVHP